MRLTPTEQNIISALSDGNRHRIKEMMGCLQDDMAQQSALNVAVTRLRKKLRPAGQDIICEWYMGRMHYRHVRLIGSFNE
jgi:hypothetical protein